MKEIILNESNKMAINLITNVLQGYPLCQDSCHPHRKY